MSSAICFNLDQSKILSSGNGLNSFRLNESRLQSKYPLIESVFKLKENIVKNGGNAGTHIFSFFMPPY